MQISGYVKRLLEPPPHHAGPVTLNRAGYQALRCILSNLAYRLRPAYRHAELKTYEDQLDRDGICAIADFLPQAGFAALQSAYAAYRGSPSVKQTRNKNNSGVTWYEGPITNKSAEDRDAQKMIDLLSYDERIIRLASHVLRRPVRAPLLLGYQWLHLPEDERDDRDIEGALHSDRHYPCVKAVFYVNENTIDNGAFVFCPGSHRLSWPRLRHEYEFSVRHQEWLRRGECTPGCGPFDRNRPIPSADTCAEMGIRQVAMEAPANTLVISNNMGFHKRGCLSPGQSRKQIRILFYEFQSPLLGRLLRKQYKRRVYGLSKR